MTTRVLSLLLAVFFLGTVLDLIRREKLTFKYAAGWLAVASLGMLFAIFDKFLAGFAHKLGFQLTSNFIFFLVICGLVFLSLVLTIFLCHQNIRNDRMAQKIGLLEHEITEFKKNIRP